VKRLLVLLILLVALYPMASLAGQNDLKSKAERTDYKETSRYEDVMEFIGKLQQVSDTVKVESFGKTEEGRALPLVILSKPAIATPLEAHASGKPIVFVMANIHAGEVEGKEATQHIMRDVVTGPLAGLLDKIILLVAPIYNADGNEKIAITNRTAQNGPEGGVGTRENSKRLDLNRDFMKMDSAEARGLIQNVFNRWDPHVAMDLHTTNGSYHGYALTYSPPLNPNTDSRIISYAREKLLPEVTRTMKSKHDYRIYYYGNFFDPADPSVGFRDEQPKEPKGWATFDHRPRFGTNYIGLRNRLAILSEAYSYLDFRARVDVTDKFVRTVLQHIAQNSAAIVSMIREADRKSRDTGLTAGNEEGYGLNFEMKPSAKPVDILVGSVTRTVDPRTNKPRLQATNEARPVKMTEFGEFKTTRRISPPSAYILKPDQKKIADMLVAHGITVEVTKQNETFDVERYTIKEMTKAQRPFQGHSEVKLKVEKGESKESFPAGSFIVSLHQPAAALVFYLLEPESDDGLATWNYFDEELERGGKESSGQVFPVYRLKSPPKTQREIIK
jgi:hypothetical protein